MICFHKLNCSYIQICYDTLLKIPYDLEIPVNLGQNWQVLAVEVRLADRINNTYATGIYLKLYHTDDVETHDDT